jgi:hypothetical protein
MGSEREATLSVSGTRKKGRALLETDEIIFSPASGASGARGASRASSASSAGGREKRILILRADIKKVTVDGGKLTLVTKKETFVLDVGERYAATWADKILRPRGLMDKLGIKAGAKQALTVRVVDVNGGATAQAFVSEVSAVDAVQVKTAGAFDLAFLFIVSKADLKKLAPLAKAVLATRAAVWIVYPKARPDPKEIDVIAAGRTAGLKDIKVARFSDTHTALKFVAPKA